MKLYYKPGACSLASHIMLHEVGADFEIEAVDTKVGRTASGRDYREINPNGYVPALETAGGETVTEGTAVLQFIADTHPDRAYAPPLGSIERARLQESLNYVASEVHKAFSPLFADGISDAEKRAAKARVKQKLARLEDMLSDGRATLVGDRFSAADAYAFVVVSWARFKEIDLTPWPRLRAYLARIAARPAAKAALTAEGLA